MLLIKPSIFVLINSFISESWWLEVIFLLSLFLIFYFIYKNRIRRIEKQKELLESQVKQRTIEIIRQKEMVERKRKMLEEEKEKTEKLLLNILPREMADELKDKGKAKA